MADADMRRMVADLPAPEFESLAFTSPPPLSEATVAVTTAGLMRPGEEWHPQEERTGFKVFRRDERDFVVGQPAAAANTSSPAPAPAGRSKRGYRTYPAYPATASATAPSARAR